MSQIELVRLMIRIFDAFENRFIPWSMRFAAAVFVGVRNFPEKFRFHRFPVQAHSPRYLAPGPQLPAWCAKLFPRIRSALIDVLVILGGVCFLLLLWLYLWT